MKILIPIILMFIFSCEDDGITPNYGCTNQNALNYDSSANVEDGSCIVSATYTYTSDIESIFINACTGCHSASGGYTPYLNSYEALDNCDCIVPYNHSSSMLYDRITRENDEEGFMPDGEDPLTDEAIHKIKIWILEGLPK